MKGNQMIQWIGIALTIIGMIWNIMPTQMPVQPQVQTVQQPEQARFMITNINVAFDTQTGKYYFQHANGQWYDFLPRPF